MRARTLVYSTFFLLLPFIGSSQRPDTLFKKPDSLSEKTGGSGGPISPIAGAAYAREIKINVPVYFILLGRSLKREFTAPLHFCRKDWIKAGEFALLTVGFGFADKPLQRFALDLHNQNKGVANLSKFITKFGGSYGVYTLAALGTCGIVFKNEKIKTATLLATQAYLTGGAMESLVKFLTRRQRPSYVDVNATEAEPTFHGPFYRGPATNGSGSSSAFPSGHTTVAFAAATVFAMQYKDKPIIPIISYSLAILVGLSRITENKHWLTDVLAGAALGYFTGRQVVNNYHRNAKLKAPKLKKNSISLNLQNNCNHIMPGLIYTFR